MSELHQIIRFGWRFQRRFWWSGLWAFLIRTYCHSSFARSSVGKLIGDGSVSVLILQQLSTNHLFPALTVSVDTELVSWFLGNKPCVVADVFVTVCTSWRLLYLVFIAFGDYLKKPHLGLKRSSGLAKPQYGESHWA